ncbi:MAG: hypothetical protein OXI33_13315 [Chloroflexota bacterium]|nr:hypothetical protein [Chloroflexota bacterium]
MPAYKTPDNLVELLGKVVRSASRTAFYGSRLLGSTGVATLDEFRAIPSTSLSEFRERALRDTLVEPSKVDWIVGADGGQSPTRTAMVENADEGAIRYDVLADAVKEQVSLDASTACAAVSTPEGRYFASEVATILIAAGAHAHVFTDDGRPRTYERLDLLEPQVVVILSPRLEEDRLPATTKLAITFNRERRLTRLPQLDVYHVDGLGFLGHSSDLDTYTLNNDVYYFEQSGDGRLMVTPVYGRVQPALRVLTEDKVEFVAESRVRFVE